MKITISSIVIGLKKLLFSTNSLAKLLSDSLLLESSCIIKRLSFNNPWQFNKPITFEVVA